MIKFYYVENKYLKEFLYRGQGGEYRLGQIPDLFLSRDKAFRAYEDYRTGIKMTGKLSPSLEIKEIDL